MMLGRVRGMVVPLAILTIAELALRARGGLSDTLAPPSAAIGAFFDIARDGSLWRATGQTLATMLAGLGIGAGGGLVVGLLLAGSRRAYASAFLAIEMLRPIPSIALLPLALMVFGFGYRMEIAVIAFATFWPALILTHGAIVQVEPRLLEVSRLLGLPAHDIARKILLPAAAPRLMTALRLAAGLALVVAVTSEIVGNPQGLGHELMISQETLRPARMLAFLAWIGFIGWAKNAALLELEQRLFKHRTDVDTAVAA
jgi:ABC-type nitrate/sulfonate/bicarbonate transport system permease component